MPIGPSFLHRPLPRPRLTMAADAARWFADSLGPALPAALRRIGWRPAYRIAGAGAEGHGLVQRSAFGQTRLAPARADSPDRAPVAVALDPAAVFVTRVELAEAARRDLAQAVGFRLEELCPIPPDETCWRLGPAETLSDGRISAAIAFARRSDVDAARGRFGPRAALVGAGVRPDGGFDFVFWAAPGEASRAARRWAGALALLAGLALFLVGAQAHLDRRLAARAEYESALLAALRRDQALAAELEAISAAAEPAFDDAGLSRRLAFLLSLGPQAVIEEAVLSADRVEAVFILPAGADMPEGASPENQGPIFPGHERYRIARQGIDP